MAINPILFKAILSMDVYNRGYGAAIKFGTAPDIADSVEYGETSVGKAVINFDMGDVF